MAKSTRVKTFFLVWMLITLCLGVTAFSTKTAAPEHFNPDGTPELPEYSDPQNWMSLPQATPKNVDVFFVHPTTFFSKENWNQDMNDATQDQDAAFTLKTQASVFAPSCNVFAPFYRQASIKVLTADQDDKDKALGIAYQDIENAFDYYLKNLNGGRAFILAGHSQGSNLLLWLLEKRFSDPALQQKLVAAYIIGWSVTRQDLEKYPHLKMSSDANQTGCIISYNTQSKEPETTIVRPDAVGVNPLLWNTSGKPAPNTLNLGAVFFSDDGRHEIPYYTSATTVNGALVIPSPQQPELLELPSKGFYHRYDYSFFYRNIEQNAKDRIKAFQQKGNEQ